MSTVRVFITCVVRSRCPCCREGALFDGIFRMHEHCPACGLCYMPWYGEWITPPCLASTVGLIAGFALTFVMLAYEVGLDGAVPPIVSVGALAAAVALAALRPSKSFWLAFLYAIGGIEVSAETRALLRWRTDASPHGDRERLREADRRARSIGRPVPATGPDTIRRGVSLRETLFPRRHRQRPPAPRRRRRPPRRPPPFLTPAGIHPADPGDSSAR